MAVKKIEDLEKLISQYIDPGKEINDIDITNLTAPGDNYGSQMYKVDIKLKSQNGTIEDLNVVAKQIPDSDFYQHVFNVQVTFNAEKEFYNTIVPTLWEFQRKYGTEILEAFPKYYGARNNLNGYNGRVDKNALMVLENLKSKGYKNLDRTIGFDLATTKLILKYLAYFHAGFLALKLNEPDTFEKKIKPHLSCYLPENSKVDLTHETSELVKLLEQSAECKHLTEALKKSLEKFVDFPDSFSEPISTVVHRDFWVNNIMLNFENDVAKDVKIVDFQMYTYDTPASDLFFFLFTSVETEVLKENLESLLQCYHQHFLQILSDHKCPTEQFSYDKFMKEISDTAIYNFGKLIFMLAFVVRGPKGGHLTGNVVPKLNISHLTQKDKSRIYWIIQECERRKWLTF